MYVYNKYALVTLCMYIYVPHIYYTLPLTSCIHPLPNHHLLAAVNQAFVPLRKNKVNFCPYTYIQVYITYAHTWNLRQQYTVTPRYVRFIAVIMYCSG